MRCLTLGLLFALRAATAREEQYIKLSCRMSHVGYECSPFILAFLIFHGSDRRQHEALLKPHGELP